MMRPLRAWVSRLAGLFIKEQRELAEEIESHLQMHIEDNLRSGMTREEARRQALIKLGGVEPTKEQYRDRRSLPALEVLLQDLRYGLRMLAKNPGFTAVAILTLALGIGAKTAAFSMLNGILLRPYPFPKLERLVLVREKRPHERELMRVLAPADVEDLARDNRSFEAFTPFRYADFNLTGVETPWGSSGARCRANSSRL